MNNNNLLNLISEHFIIDQKYYNDLIDEELTHELAVIRSTIRKMITTKDKKLSLEKLTIINAILKDEIELIKRKKHSDSFLDSKTISLQNMYNREILSDTEDELLNDLGIEDIECDNFNTIKTFEDLLNDVSENPKDSNKQKKVVLDFGFDPDFDIEELEENMDLEEDIELSDELNFDLEEFENENCDETTESKTPIFEIVDPVIQFKNIKKYKNEECMEVFNFIKNIKNETKDGWKILTNRELKENCAHPNSVDIMRQLVFNRYILKKIHKNKSCYLV